MKSPKSIAFMACAAISLAAAAAPVVVSDAMRGPALKDVRLEGWLGQKMDRFISRRLVDSFMREQIFDEARQTFEFRDDDEATVQFVLVYVIEYGIDSTRLQLAGGSDYGDCATPNSAIAVGNMFGAQSFVRLADFLQTPQFQQGKTKS